MDLFTDTPAIIIMATCGVAMFAVLFLQSGFDKVIDWKGNLSWLKGHFEKSPFAKVVPLLLGIILVTELAAGLCCGYGVVEMLVFDETAFAQLGLILSGLNLLMLFAGQRLAKDYPGAAVLANYFLFALVLLFFLG